jgi:hypothetical protein
LAVEGDDSMERFEALISILDYSLDTRRKRHIAGGILLSVSLLFGGLAFTAMTLKNEEEKSYE